MRSVSVSGDGLVLLAGDWPDQERSFVQVMDTEARLLVYCEVNESRGNAHPWVRFASDGRTLGIMTDSSMAVVRLELDAD